MKLTYGVEHELADIPINTKLPVGFGWDRKDITIVSSNGIANDPSGKGYQFGGEINTPPTSTPKGQAEHLLTLKQLFPMATINYRSNLHIHVRLEGLRNDLVLLKQLQGYIHRTMPLVFEHIAPLPRPTGFEFMGAGKLEGALRRWKRRKISHRTLLTPQRLKHQLSANTLGDFFNWEVPQDKSGKPLWHCQPRLCVNLRHLLSKEETIEFRHFPGTLDGRKLLHCVSWCGQYIRWAIEDLPIEKLLAKFNSVGFSKFPKYDHELERRYRATVHDGTVSKEQIQENIRLILAGEFK